MAKYNVLAFVMANYEAVGIVVKALVYCLVALIVDAIVDLGRT